MCLTFNRILKKSIKKQLDIDFLLMPSEKEGRRGKNLCKKLYEPLMHVIKIVELKSPLKDMGYRWDLGKETWTCQRLWINIQLIAFTATINENDMTLKIPTSDVKQISQKKILSISSPARTMASTVCIRISQSLMPAFTYPSLVCPCSANYN